LTDLIERDRRRVWHPYAGPIASPLFGVVSASGVRIRLEDGRELVDGMSSWWSVIHGYRHPRIEAAVKAQLERLPHVMFGGLTHEPAVRLCERLAAMAPGELERVFLSDSGSVAVEVALKLALQYWQARGRPERRRVLALRGGYHGDTFGAMAVCDPVSGMHGLFAGTLANQLFAERPARRFGERCQPGDLDDLKSHFDAHRDELAAVILEPIVQGAGGMWFYSADYLRALRGLCDESGVLLIADEIATGFGRTGRLFACEHGEIAPDILCVGKALTGGTLTLAATLASAAVCRQIEEGEPGVFMHGPTFMGNALACAAANASLDLLEAGDWVQRGTRGLSRSPGRRRRARARSDRCGRAARAGRHGARRSGLRRARHLDPTLRSARLHDAALRDRARRSTATHGRYSCRRLVALLMNQRMNQPINQPMDQPSNQE
jgi:adenosylmethionine-8-amino-7-oxononanoate aminotransferase